MGMVFKQLANLRDPVDLNYRIPLDVTSEQQSVLLRQTFEFVRDATNELVRAVLENSPYGDYDKELLAQSKLFSGDALTYADLVVAEELYNLYPKWQALYPDYHIVPFLDAIRRRAFYILARRGFQVLAGYDVSEDEVLSCGYVKGLNYVILAMPPLDYSFEDSRFIVPTISDRHDVYSKPTFYEKFNPLPPFHDFMRMLRILVSGQRQFDYEYFRLYNNGSAWYISYKITPALIRRFLDVGHYVLLRDDFARRVLRRLAGALVAYAARRRKYVEGDAMEEARPSAGEMRIGRFPHRFNADLAEVKVETGYSFAASHSKTVEQEDVEDGIDSED
jgi:hypothetical protein